MTVQDLPALNATLNFLSACLLLSGYASVRAGKLELHKRLMVAALVTSAIFLTSYLTKHYLGYEKSFPDLGFIKVIYLLILVPHVILAVIMVPMILKTFWHAGRQEWVAHRKIARLTFPIWMYVSVTGVIVYFMLYVWFA